MSTVRTSYPLLFEIFVGSEKTFLTTITDPDTSEAVDLSNTSTFATGNFKIVKPDDTIITTISISYTSRASGVISFTVPNTVTTILNAGNWIGNVQLLDSTSKIIEQQIFNFNILEV